MSIETKTRRKKTVTPERIREEALLCINKFGLINLNRVELCKVLDIPPGSFFHYAGCNFGEFVERLRQEGHTGPEYVATKARTNPDLRRASLLANAMRAASSVGYTNLTRANVARLALCSRALISTYFDTVENLRSAVLAEAIRTENAEIIAQGLMARDPLVSEAGQRTQDIGAAFLSSLS